MNEAKTRQEIIDKCLARAGWLVDQPGMVTQEFDIFLGPDAVKETQSPYGGHQFSDDVLLKKDSSPQAVVEAKKTSRDAQLGREQALQYAQFLNASNKAAGKCFWLWLREPGKPAPPLR